MAETLICAQADTIMKCNVELVEQCKTNRSLNSSTPAPSSSSLPISKKSYADIANVPSPTVSLVVKSTENNVKFDDGDTKVKIASALQKVSVNSTRVTQQGDLIVHFPDENSKQKASDSLKNVFDNEVSVENLKKLTPKLTVVGLPMDFEPDKLIESLLNKDENICIMIDSDCKMEVLGCWEVKDGAGVSQSKKLALRVSPEIRNHFIVQNQGYMYLNLARYRVFDRINVMQCFHCYGYNHLAKFCPAKSRLPTCGRCSKTHETKKCQSTVERCINCLKSNAQTQKCDHSAYSYKCPIYEKEKTIQVNRTNYFSKN